MINQPRGKGLYFPFTDEGSHHTVFQSDRLALADWERISECLTLLSSKSLRFPGEPRTRARAHWTLSHTVRDLIIWGTLRLCFLLIEIVKVPAYTLLQGNWSSNLVLSMTLSFSGVNRIYLPTLKKKAKLQQQKFKNPANVFKKSSNNFISSLQHLPFAG